jgi:hypothetical protein
MPTLLLDVRVDYEQKAGPGTLYYEVLRVQTLRAKDENLPQDQATPPQLQHIIPWDEVAGFACGRLACLCYAA